MRIYQMGPAMPPPKLSHLGIRVQTLTETAAEPANSLARPGEPSADRFEHQALSQLSSDLSIRLFAFSSTAGANASLPVGDLHAGGLLEALRKVGNQLDLNSALNLHAAASELVASIRSRNGLTPEAPVQLQLEGAFGRIEIDTARLEPEALKNTLGAGLNQQPAHDLLRAHGQLAGLSQQIRAGFPQTADVSQIWVSALKTPDFQPASFFTRTLGFNPLEQHSSVSHLLAGIPNPTARPAPLSGLAAARALPELPRGQGPRASQMPHAGREAAQLSAEALGHAAALAEGDELAAKSEALIAVANELERSLELSPSVEAPDILKLLRSFQKIIRQLDTDIGRILHKQTLHKQFEHKLLAQFSEQLRSNLRFNQERQDALQNSGSERLKLLINQSLVLLRAKLWLAQASGADSQLQQALSALQAR